MKILSYIVFYLVQWTWGIILNIAGFFTAIGMLITGHKPYWCGPYVYFRTKWNFGGLELGMFFIIGDRCDSCAPHEMGHGIQNMFFGPLMLFIVSLPSMYRYWLREMDNKEKYAWIICIAGFIVGITIGVCGAIFNLSWLIVVGLCVILYFVCIHFWSMIIEIPRYNNGYPNYDSIWIEGYATKVGNKFFENKWWIHVIERNKKESK